MNSHKNASLTPRGRAHLVKTVTSQGCKLAAQAAGVSARTAARWHRRHQLEGAAGLLDRSSRPHRSPKRTSADKAERTCALRRNHRLTYTQIGERVGLSKSTVARLCGQAGLNKLAGVQDVEPVRRYERDRPGELLHLDMKKLGRFERPGHRVTGDRTQNSRRAGWQALHVAIDDHSRVGFSQMLDNENSHSASQFLIAALRHYKELGVRVTALLTDNGSAYRSKRFAKLLRRLGIKHKRTRPYTPRTNGKAERFIPTLLREWAYAYRYPSSDVRAAELRPWMQHYNFHRPHSAIGHMPPASRLGIEVNNVLRNYN